MPVNLYGSGDHFDLETAHVIPAIIRKCTEAMSRGEKKVVLWGTRSPTREFLYMEDCAEGILLAAEGYDRSDPVARQRRCGDRWSGASEHVVRGLVG